MNQEIKYLSVLLAIVVILGSNAFAQDTGITSFPDQVDTASEVARDQVIMAPDPGFPVTIVPGNREGAYATTYYDTDIVGGQEVKTGAVIEVNYQLLHAETAGKSDSHKYGYLIGILAHEWYHIWLDGNCVSAPNATEDGQNNAGPGHPDWGGRLDRYCDFSAEHLAISNCVIQRITAYLDLNNYSSSPTEQLDGAAQAAEHEKRKWNRSYGDSRAEDHKSQGSGALTHQDAASVGLALPDGTGSPPDCYPNNTVFGPCDWN